MFNHCIEFEGAANSFSDSEARASTESEYIAIYICDCCLLKLYSFDKRGRPANE